MTRWASVGRLGQGTDWEQGQNASGGLRATSYIRRGHRANQPPLPQGKDQPARAVWPSPILGTTDYCPTGWLVSPWAPRPQTSGLRRIPHRVSLPRGSGLPETTRHLQPEQNLLCYLQEAEGTQRKNLSPSLTR